jgi:DNA-binding FadR family transcriptional regulator
MGIIGDALRQGDAGPFNETDFEFHDLWVLNCGNPLLITHLLRLRGHIQRIINFAGQFQNHTELALAEHYVILDAMEAGDNVALRRAVDVHISSVTERLIEKLEQAA